MIWYDIYKYNIKYKINIWYSSFWDFSGLLLRELNSKTLPLPFLISSLLPFLLPLLFPLPFLFPSLLSLLLSVLVSVTILPDSPKYDKLSLLPFPFLFPLPLPFSYLCSNILPFKKESEKVDPKSRVLLWKLLCESDSLISVPSSPSCASLINL